MPSIARNDDAASLIAAATGERRSVLTEPESKAFLRSLGIPVPRGLFVPTAEQASDAFEFVGAPVVIKAVARELTHKSDVGGVIFPVSTAADARAACRMIATRVRQQRSDIELEGFLIEAYRPASPEWILGLRMDPQFGPAILFGLGGIYVEALQQISFRLAPLCDKDIDALLSEKPATRILDGMRGRSAIDWVALKAVIQRLSDLTEQPDIIDRISEIEINPLMATEEGVLALDALIILRS